MLLARYDREVAAALFEPIDSYLHSLAARPGLDRVLNTPIMAQGLHRSPGRRGTHRIADTASGFSTGRTRPIGHGSG